jgi:competence CoiA-like predicted nuclease
MLFANVNGQKVEAKPNTMGICPSCEQTVFPKCGEIKVWHWAHRKDKSCDSWYEPETEWHKNWKLVFGKEHCEIAISKGGVRHIADVWTKENVIIELQNSPIQKSIIRQREIFYGESMIWVINGKPFKENFHYHRTRSVQLDEEDEHYHRYNHLASKHETQPRKDEFTFSWSWSKKSWTDAQRQVFIDFGDETLFRVEEGMGTSGGKGKQISKETFLKEYGGNTELLETLIDKTNKLM